MRAVNIVGYKKSGKTTLSVALAEELGKRGLSVGMVKSCGCDRLDKADTDTDKMLGVAQAVGAVAPKETALFWNGRKYIYDLLPLLGAEFVVIEGAKDLGWLPRVVLPKADGDVEGLGADLALCTYGDHGAEGLLHLTDVAALADLVMEKAYILPGLDCGDCGRPDCRAMSAHIVAGKAKPGDCKARQDSMTVKVNGVDMGLNHFVRDIVAGSIKGMLAQLHGYQPGTIEITLKV